MINNETILGERIDETFYYFRLRAELSNQLDVQLDDHICNQLHTQLTSQLRNQLYIQLAIRPEK